MEEMLREESLARWIARKDPQNEIWKDAAWTDLDASYCALVHPNGNVLIYCQGNKPEQNIMIPNLHWSRVNALRIKQGMML